MNSIETLKNHYEELIKTVSDLSILPKDSMVEINGWKQK